MNSESLKSTDRWYVLMDMGPGVLLLTRQKYASLIYPIRGVCKYKICHTNSCVQCTVAKLTTKNIDSHGTINKLHYQ